MLRDKQQLTWSYGQRRAVDKEGGHWGMGEEASVVGDAKHHDF